MKVRAVGRHLLIRTEKERVESKTAGGIVLPHSSTEREEEAVQIAEVVDVGDIAFEDLKAFKARQDAIRNQEALVKTLKGEYELLKSLQGKGLVGENDPDIVGAPDRPSAWDRYEAERNVLIDMMKSGEAPASTAPAATTPAPAASAEGRKAKVLADFAALPPEQQTDEAMLSMMKAAGLK